MNKSKHIKLLKQVPAECFYYANNVIKKLNNEESLSCANIGLCYKDLALALSKNSSKGLNIPRVREFNNWYEFLDYINPRKNHVYEYIYKNELSLPKVYKNAIVNKTSSNIPVFIKPNQGVSFKEANDLKKEFINTAGIQHPMYVEEYLGVCYKKLYRLMAKTTFAPNKRFQTYQGSIVLREELIDLFYSQNAIRDAAMLTRYSPYEREDLINDIIQHKEAMFGELRKTKTR